MKKENTFAISTLLVGASMVGFSSYRMVEAARDEKNELNKLVQLSDSIVQHGKILAQMSGDLHEVEILKDDNVLMFVDAGGDYLSLDEKQESAVIKRDDLKNAFAESAHELQQANIKSYAHLGGVVTGFGLAVISGIMFHRPRKKRKKQRSPITG